MWNNPFRAMSNFFADPSVQPVCKGKGKGNGKGIPGFKTEFCDFVWRSHGCRWGKGCWYAHSRQELRRPDGQLHHAPLPAGTPLPADTPFHLMPMMGTTPPADNSVNNSDRVADQVADRVADHRSAYKTEFCWSLTHGHACQHGVNCWFAHSETDRLYAAVAAGRHVHCPSDATTALPQAPPPCSRQPTQLLPPDATTALPKPKAPPPCYPEPPCYPDDVADSHQSLTPAEAAQEAANTFTPNLKEDLLRFAAAREAATRGVARQEAVKRAAAKQKTPHKKQQLPQRLKAQ